ncbi:quinolinate synthase NadA [Anaerovibrio sp.]|uniref:quinolinate synthase NadA n=1 Tax=Anaerovibrio sp. TaxID=1872532 RepID=UPI003F17135F
MTIQEEIRNLKAEKDAVILAHYYVAPEVQELADYVGDSFYLSKVAAGLDCKVLVFCGVSFMGESACLLSPDKEVLMPDMAADCPMAHMVTEEQVLKHRGHYDDLAVVCYINSTAEIKSWSDVCVTSANAVDIVRRLPQKNILFIPDKNLGRYVAEKVPEKNVMLVNGFCPVHQDMLAEELAALKEAHPEAAVCVHPECNEAVTAMADYVGSTSGIIKFASESKGQEFIVGTEAGVLYKLQAENPDKKFYFARTTPICRDMKLVTLEKVLAVLKEGGNRASVPEKLAEKAKRPLERMLALAK